MAQLMVVLDATIVNIALPSAQRALGFSTADRQWVITAYALAFGGLLLVGGRLSDLLGRKRTFIAGLAGFAAASAAGGAAPGFAALLAARAVQGAFGALLAPSALALLATTFTDPRERGQALGIFTAIAGGGGAIGLILGGVLTEYLSWRWCLYVNVVFAAAALAGAVPLISDPAAQSRARRLTCPAACWPPAAWPASSTASARPRPTAGPARRPSARSRRGVVLLAAFAAVERRVARPLVPLGIIADRIRGTAYLGALIAGIGLIGTFLLVTYYLQGVLGFTPLRAGLAFLPFLGRGHCLANFVSNVGLDRFGPRIVVPVGMILAAGAAGLLTGSASTAATAPGCAGTGPARARCRLHRDHGLQPRPGRRPPGRRRRGRRPGEQQQPGRRLAGRRPAQHDRRQCRRELPGPARAAGQPAAATVHGDTIAFTFLVVLFAAGAVITALLYPRRA